jgi:hypothetical protein
MQDTCENGHRIEGKKIVSIFIESKNNSISQFFVRCKMHANAKKGQWLMFGIGSTNRVEIWRKGGSQCDTDQ